MTTNSDNNVSLYIHVPFCVKKCAYCAFFSAPCASEAQKDEYVSALSRRISSLPKLKAQTVYFGGGTPTVLGAKRLSDLLDAVLKYAYVAPDAEITLEANPGTVDAKDFKTLAAAGFNRLSLGMQSADDGTLALLGRIHTNREFLRCYDSARRYFGNISLDMIFALPGSGFEKTLEQIFACAPEHVSAYSLILEEGTPLFDRRFSLRFPDEDEEERQYDAICEAAVKKGYKHYEISSFALPGRESRHNRVYWERGEYVGLGPAAHSFYQNKRFSVPSDTNLFIKNSSLPFLGDTDFARAAEITPEEAEEERIMLGLRLADGVVIPPEKIAAAREIVSAGYGTLNGSVFALNERGFRISNEIIARILR